MIDLFSSLRAGAGRRGGPGILSRRAISGLPHRLWLLAMMVGLMAAAPAAAQTEGQATIRDLLEQLQRDRLQEQQINQERLDRFLSARDDQQAMVAEARARLAALEAQAEAVEQRFNENEVELANQEELLRQRAGAFGELFQTVRQAAGELKNAIDLSMTAAQLPGRGAPLSRMASSDTVPSIEQIERLWFEYQRETVELGRTVRFEAPIITPEGERRMATVTRIGPFTALAEGGDFLDYLTAEGAFLRHSRQPTARFTDAAADFLATEDGFAPAVYDPSRGAILARVIQSRRLVERIDQAGLIGTVIIGVALVGLLLVLWRLALLIWTGWRTERQLHSDTPRRDNPLGRVLAVYPEHKDAPVEVLERELDEAIMRETPRLERGLKTVRVLFSAAPLLGLLGTVTGMIATFEAMSLFGSGDPQLMAGGISSALMTTAMGLCTAIPLLLLHSLARSRSEALVEILEEQAAGLVAEQARRQAGR